MTDTRIVKLIRFTQGDSRPRVGALVDGTVIDLAEVWGADPVAADAGYPEFPSTMREVIRGGDALLDHIIRVAEAEADAGRGRSEEEIRLLTPIERPGQILCFGRVYMGHIEVGGYEVPPRPNIFLKGPNTMVGPDQEVVLPFGWDRFTYGTELCVVVGKEGRRATADDAFEWVYGYTILNDVTARGEMQPKNKLFDTFAPVGPCIVPRRYIADPSALGLVMRVNGELTQQGDVASALWSTARLIEYATEYITVEIGDLISTGDLGAPDLVTAGDVLEASIDPIGVLRNPVVAEQAR